MYGVIMAEIVDSSLMAEGGKNACWVFSMMIAHADKDHCLRKDPRTFARQIDCTDQEFQQAVELLQSTDPHSNIPDFEGRRIIPLSELPNFEGNRGWFIVNREHYINCIKSSSRDRVIKHRRKEKFKQIINNLPNCNVTETLQDASLSIYISTSISTDLFKELLMSGIDMDAWALYEQYRKQINKPFKTDRGRRAQMNKIQPLSKKQQAEVIQQTIDNEWIRLIIPEEKKPEKKNGGIPTASQPEALEAFARKHNITARPGETHNDLYRRCVEATR